MSWGFKMYITKKKISGKEYYYLRQLIRKGKKVISRDVAYLGKNKTEAEEKAGKIIQERERIKNAGSKKPVMKEEKKIYLVHGWGGSSKYKLFEWIKEQLKEHGKVYVFDMPNTNNPKIEEWVKFLKKNVNSLDENTYFVGYSIGCQTILRFLEQLGENIKIGGCVFIAGWFNLTGLNKDEERIAQPWLKEKINFDKIRKHCNNFLAIFSDNDSLVPLANEKIFKEKLGAKTLIKKSQGHFDETENLNGVIDFLIKNDDEQGKISMKEDRKELTIDELASFCKRDRKSVV